MRVIKITGGLGNQMFQYLFGQYLSSKYQIEVKYDISSFENQPDFLDKRKCELFSFTFDLPIIDNKDFTDFKQRSNSGKILHFLKNILTKPSTTFLPIPEAFYRISCLVPNFISNRYYFGYWQTKRYLSIAQQEQSIVFELSDAYSNLLKNQHYIDQIKSANSVSLQVRRGDFLSANEWICDLNYYERAISIINKKIKNPKFFIFSDDIEWCKKELNFNVDMTFIEPNINLPFEDMLLMSNCKHNIIVNSTYGWWGTSLNLNKEKICISPLKWDHHLNSKDFIKV